MSAEVVSVSVLGPIAAANAAGQCDLGGPKQRRLLAAIAVEKGPAGGDQLIDRVWGADLPADPQNALRTALTRLRRALGEGAVVTEPDGWRLADWVVVDRDEFERHVDAAASSDLDTTTQLALLGQALHLWRGDAFADVSSEDWARPEADRLEELRLLAMERRYAAMLDAGMHTDALPGLTADSAANPLRDRLVGLRMLALYRTGRKGEATRVFQEYRGQLLNEVGLEPGADLVELDRRIIADESSLIAASSSHHVLRGYKLGEQLGEGAFATVFRGTQPSVDREVAVKIIRSQLANRPEFIRRFEAEAHLIARLEHPYIVPLYDFWREPDRACLVFRYLRGGTLEQRLASTTGLPLDECMTMVEQVGSALAEAHLAGVVHRDVKPANVFLDERGNFYLGDFGIALESAELSDPSAALSAGSPAYASPEQLRRQAVGPAADVHGLGISLYEALTGRLPFADAADHAELLQRQLSDPIPPVRARRPDLPAAVDDVIGLATAKNPAERYQTVQEFISALQAAAGRRVDHASSRGAGSATMVPQGAEHNPYKGLRPFTEADALEFFGRERLIDRMAESLSQPGTPGRVLAVVGPSGIGKSSAVRAGLLPALRAGAVPGSAAWLIATALPGADPFEEVAAALLRVATAVPDNLMAQLTDDHRGLSRVAKVMAPNDAEILLVIDQFEELFTHTDLKTTRRFLDSLEYAITDARCPLRIILTVRADFWDRPLRHGSFARLIDDSIVNVTALAPDELERAIVAPANRIGAEFEPGLVSEIVADVSDQPGALPLLQYALTQLWDDRVSELLTRQSYRDLGGVAGALASTAEDIHATMSSAERAALRTIFGRLVALDANTQDTRRRALRSELGSEPEIDEVLEQFGAARLLSFDRDESTRETTVEVAHEALIREWPRLRRWIEQDREGWQLLRHLHQAAADWAAAGHPDSELYRGSRLESAAGWAADHDREITELERSFLEASIDLRREAEESRLEQLDQERRSNQRLRVALASVAIVAATAVIAGAIALGQRRTANEQRAEAEAAAIEAGAQRELAESAAVEAEQTRFAAEIRRLVSDSRDLNESNPPLAMLLAATAYSLDPEIETLGALQHVLARTDGFLGRMGTDRQMVDVAFVDESSFVSRTSNELELWNLDGTNEVIASASGVVDMEVSGSLVALLRPAGAVSVFDLESRENTELQTGVDGDAARVTIDRESGRIAVADSATIEVYDRNLERVWTVAVAEVGDVRGCDDCVTPALMGDTLFVGVGLEVFRFDADGELEFRSDVAADIDDLPEDWQDAGHFRELAADPRREHVWVQDSGTSIGYLRVDDGTPVATFAGPQLFPSLSVAPGRVLHGVDLLEVDTATGRRLDWAGLAPTASSLSPDGSTVVFAGDEGLEVRALDGRGPIARIAPVPGATMASLDATNSVVSWTEWPTGTHGLFDLDASGPVAPDLGDAFMQNWMPSGSLTTWGRDGRSRVWSADDYREISGDLPAQIWGFFLTTPGDAAAVFGETGPRAGVITVRDIQSGEILAEIDDLLTDDPTNPAAPGRITWLHFSPDGTLAAAPRWEGQLGLFDTSDWTLLRQIDVPDQVVGATFSHDGSTLAMHAASGQVYYLDLESGLLEAGPLAGDAFARGLMAGMSFSPDDRRLHVGVPEGIEMWDVLSGRQIGSTFPNATLLFGTTSYDGRYGLTADSERIYVWDLDVERYLSIACVAAGRDMTETEWEQYGLTGEPYDPVCTGYL